MKPSLATRLWERTQRLLRSRFKNGMVDRVTARLGVIVAACMLIAFADGGVAPILLSFALWVAWFVALHRFKVSGEEAIVCESPTTTAVAKEASARPPPILNCDDPASISDAIESELREAEERRARRTLPWVRVALRIARSLGWIVRPEAMTAYATAAAALAAFLAVRAADRQEKATFTSALYAKQVDALAGLQAKYNVLVKTLVPYWEYQVLAEAINKLPHPGLFAGPTRNPLSTHAIEISGVAAELVNAARAAEIVFPAEATNALDEVAARALAIEVAAHIDFSRFIGGGLIGRLLGEKADDATLKTIRESSDIIGQRISIVGSCATPMLRNGEYVAGPGFSNCVKSALSRHDSQASQ
jgi:hypothetical protein